MPTALTRPHLRLVAADGLVVGPAAHATLAERLLAFAGAQPGLRVVEFTFGPGRLTWRLLAEGCDARSVDLAVSPTGSLPDEWYGAFDVGIATFALHQVTDPALLLADVATCIRPGGYCAGLEPLADDIDSSRLRNSALHAGLAFFRAEPQAAGSAVFWRAQVPALQSLPQPQFAIAA